MGKYLLPFNSLFFFFILLMVSIAVPKLFSFFSWLEEIFQKILIIEISEVLLPMLSSMSITVLSLTFKSFIHCEFILAHGVRRWSSFIFLHVSAQFSQHHLLNTLSLSHCMFLSPLSNISWPHRYGFISEHTILFYWSICLFLCHTKLF